MRRIELQCHLVVVSELLERFQHGCIFLHENGTGYTILHGNRLVGFLHPVKVDLAHIALAIVDGELGAQFVGHGWS